MSAFAGVQGYETLSSAQQRERDFATVVDHGLASKPSAPPSHLSRVLYIPPLHNSRFHALVHDVSAEYKHVIGHSPLGGSEIIGDAAMGSRLFMTRLGTMRKPAATISDAESQYAIDAKVELTQTLIKLEKVNTGDASRIMTM
ncbi:4-coumarate--CoA ligase-like 7 [Purpureocillium lavendulum]|uniref:4-coumarate--CoA ligase-like 7 n=1 Tax=Purpureocillium lavendulum TaxID=1247861 RepID=A0AB34FDH7_9HYPO|nr:4-coumarate--CoA ligase-like 7 [Purpureocillium lavendulum]